LILCYLTSPDPYERHRDWRIKQNFVCNSKKEKS
jgi:hypothetical protein